MYTDEARIPNPPGTWIEHAACRNHDPNLFFPADGGWHIAKQAIAICNECPVRTDCLTYALEENQQYGIWGGTSYKQRQTLRRQRAA